MSFFIWASSHHPERYSSFGLSAIPHSGILKKVDWARTSDVKFEEKSNIQLTSKKKGASANETNSKKIEEILRFYDRSQEQQCVSVLIAARVDFPKGPLDMVTKLRVFSRRLGTIECAVCDESCMQFSLKLAYQRLKNGQLKEDQPQRKLETDDRCSKGSAKRLDNATAFQLSATLTSGISFRLPASSYSTSI